MGINPSQPPLCLKGRSQSPSLLKRGLGGVTGIRGVMKGVSDCAVVYDITADANLRRFLILGKGEIVVARSASVSTGHDVNQD